MKASSLFYWFILIYLLFPLSAVAVECEGPYIGKRPTPEQLKKILEDHKAWLKKKEKSNDEPLMANLCKSDLSGADLSKANLNKADLSWADLSGADLSKANLSGANLSEANLSEANLSEADLSEADLSEADLTHL